MVEPMVGLSADRRAAGSAGHLACLKAVNWADCLVDSRVAVLAGVMVEPLVGLSAYRRAAGSAAHLACLKAANWADCWVDTRAAMDGTWVGK